MGTCHNNKVRLMFTVSLWCIKTEKIFGRKQHPQSVVITVPAEVLRHRVLCSFSYQYLANKALKSNKIPPDVGLTPQEYGYKFGDTSGCSIGKIFKSSLHATLWRENRVRLAADQDRKKCKF